TLLNVVVAEGAAVLELLASENETLLVWGNSLLVLDLGLDVLDSIARLDLEGDGLASQSFHEDLHVGRDEDSYDVVKSTSTSCEVESLEQYDCLQANTKQKWREEPAGHYYMRELPLLRAGQPTAHALPDKLDKALCLTKTVDDLSHRTDKG